MDNRRLISAKNISYQLKALDKFTRNSWHSKKTVNEKKTCLRRDKKTQKMFCLWIAPPDRGD